MLTLLLLAHLQIGHNDNEFLKEFAVISSKRTKVLKSVEGLSSERFHFWLNCLYYLCPMFFQA